MEIIDLLSLNTVAICRHSGDYSTWNKEICDME